jgi:hypothetical protein
VVVVVVLDQLDLMLHQEEVVVMVEMVLQLQFLQHQQLMLVEVVVDQIILQMEAEELVVVGQQVVLQELLEQ